MIYKICRYRLFSKRTLNVKIKLCIQFVFRFGFICIYADRMEQTKLFITILFILLILSGGCKNIQAREFKANINIVIESLKQTVHAAAV